MQIAPINNYKQSNINFSGSFKISDLNALIDDYDETEITQEEETIKTSKTDVKRSFSILRQTVDLDDEGTKTYITYSAANQSEVNNKLSDTMLGICKKNGVNPQKDLFMISGLDDVNRRYILFNSFYKDEQTNDDCVQMFYLLSQDELLTNLQKKVVKIFNDPKNKHFLSTCTSDNPLRNLSRYGSNIHEPFNSAIDNLEAISRDFSDQNYYDENLNVSPVIYTADGKYTKYRTIYLRK